MINKHLWKIYAKSIELQDQTLNDKAGLNNEIRKIQKKIDKKDETVKRHQRTIDHCEIIFRSVAVGQDEQHIKDMLGVDDNINHDGMTKAERELGN